MIQMSKYFVKKLSCPNLHNCLSRPVPAVVHILTSLMFPCGVLVENQSPVTLRPLELLGLEPTTRSTVSLCESVSTSESDEVACWCCSFSSFHHATSRNWLLCAQTRLCEQHFRSDISLPVILSMLEVGEGQMILFRYLWRVMHKSNLGSGKATTFLPKISKLPRLTPPPPIKNVPSLTEGWKVFVIANYPFRIEIKLF